MIIFDPVDQNVRRLRDKQLPHTGFLGQRPLLWELGEIIRALSNSRTNALRSLRTALARVGINPDEVSNGA